MNVNFVNEPMLDMFIYETGQNLEQLENCVLNSERAGVYAESDINEIFRIMHTIKGSSSMMMFNNITKISHALEDLFSYMREQNPQNIDSSQLSDIVFEVIDFIKLEVEKIKHQDTPDGNPDAISEQVKAYLEEIKNGEGSPSTVVDKVSESKTSYYVPGVKVPPVEDLKSYEALIFFEDDCEMENIRAFTIIHNLSEITEYYHHWPEDIIQNENSIGLIKENGFKINFQTDRSLQDMHTFFTQTAFIKHLELYELEQEKPNLADKAQEVLEKLDKPDKYTAQLEKIQNEAKSTHQGFISVDVVKLDLLMDLMGEMVIAEAMVTQNSEMQSIRLESFEKASRQLQKITGEMQDMIMSIRMVPVSGAFHKMHRIVRDMSRRLDKKVDLELIGENTEVDKNIIEHLNDPLMHIVRNAVDHGIETPSQREKSGKSTAGRIILEAKHAGNDVLIIVKDDGKGINKKKVLEKAQAKGLLTKAPEEMLDREIFNLILLPGFSTNESATEYSGRGVGMDVVVKNLEAVGGSVSVESVEGKGTSTILKIPLTLAIIDGMNIRVGECTYTLPTTSIAETFRAEQKDLIKDPDGNEMIMRRGICYPIQRLSNVFESRADSDDFCEGIMLMVEQDEKFVVLFADELLGQHQVVVKTLPEYMRNINKVECLAGCTLLGDGSISLILNIPYLVNN